MPRFAFLIFILAASVVWSGCPDDPVNTDAGPTDAGPALDTGAAADAGADDAGTNDAGTMPTPGLAWITDIPNTSYGSPRLFQAETGPEILLSFGAVFGNRDPNAIIGGAMSIRVDDGAIVWQIDRDEELFSVAAPLDLGDDSKQAYLFGGKQGGLIAVDAETGEQLLEFTPSGEASRQAEIWNWYTGMQVADISGDGIGEFLVTNGGDDRADIGEPRPQGWLIVLNGADLTIIHKLPVPDAAETYCSPALWQQGGRQWVVYGNGGETLPGSLWAVPLTNVLAGNLDEQVELVPAARERGSIAPASFADLDGDGATELIATPFDGRVVVLSGRDRSVLWQHDTPAARESAASSVVGDFDGDGDLDVFASLTQGIFPVWTGSEARAFDGATGEILFEDSVSLQVIIGTAIAADVDEDGKDEVLFSRASVPRSQNDQMWSEMLVLHVDEGRIEMIGEQEGLLGSAGWVGDADGDGYLEWYASFNWQSLGRVARYNLSGRTPERIAWGGYMGTRHDGHY